MLARPSPTPFWLPPTSYPGRLRPVPAHPPGNRPCIHWLLQYTARFRLDKPTHCPYRGANPQTINRIPRSNQTSTSAPSSQTRRPPTYFLPLAISHLPPSLAQSRELRLSDSWKRPRPASARGKTISTQDEHSSCPCSLTYHHFVPTTHGPCRDRVLASAYCEIGIQKNAAPGPPMECGALTWHTS
jgi:hypothetical protein